MKALFTTVSVDSAISIIKHRLEQDTQLHLRPSMTIQHIIILLEFCLKIPISSFKVSIMSRYRGSHGFSN